MRGFLIAASFALSAAAAAQSGGYYDGRGRSYDDLEPRMSLEEARRARELGVEPLPGERTGIRGPQNRRGGQSRLNDDYWERQRQLDEDLERAQRRYERERSRDYYPR